MREAAGASAWAVRELISKMLGNQELCKRGMVLAFGDDEEGANDGTC